MPQHRFKEGNTYGVGRPRLSDDEKALLKLTRKAFRLIVARYINKHPKELKKIHESDASLTALELMTIKVIMKAHNAADTRRIDWLFKHTF